MKKDDAYCLVLSGGGTKGVYHIGVWKALKELGIEVNAFVGNSIGAIIAGFLAQGEDKALEEIGANIGLDNVLNVPDSIVEDGELKITKKTLPLMRRFYRDFHEHRGLDTSPLRELVYDNLDEKKIRDSGNDLGIVTFNLTDMKAEEAFIEDMPAGTVLDYLMASAAVPGFESPRIKGRRYIDGGVYDNMPYAMARRRGYKRIIIVDISGMGLNRRPNIRGGVTVYIKNSIQMGGILDFKREFLDSFMELGYLDTLRTFDKLKGYSYFLSRDDDNEKRFSDFLTTEKGRDHLAVFLSKHEYRNDISRAEVVRHIFPRAMRYEKKLLLVLIDCAADFVEVDRVHQYSYGELYTAIKEKRDLIDGRIRREFSESKRSLKVSKAVESILKNSLKRNEFERPPYYYYRLLDFVLKEKTVKLLNKRFFVYFPAIRAAEFFLIIMDEFWSDERDAEN